MGDDVLTASYLINKMPSSVLNYKPPIALLMKPTTTYSILPKGFALFVLCTTMGDLEERTEGSEMCFYCYSAIKKRYKCYHPSIRKVFISTDVTFREHESFFCRPSLQGGRNEKERISLPQPLTPLPDNGLLLEDTHLNAGENGTDRFARGKLKHMRGPDVA